MQFAKDGLWRPYRNYPSAGSIVLSPFAEEERPKFLPLPTMLWETRLVGQASCSHLGKELHCGHFRAKQNRVPWLFPDISEATILRKIIGRNYHSHSLTVSEYQSAADGFERSHSFLSILNLLTLENSRKSWSGGILNVGGLLDSSVATFMTTGEHIKKVWVIDHAETRWVGCTWKMLGSSN